MLSDASLMLVAFLLCIAFFKIFALIQYWINSHLLLKGCEIMMMAIQNVNNQDLLREKINAMQNRNQGHNA